MDDREVFLFGAFVALPAKATAAFAYSGDKGHCQNVRLNKLTNQDGEDAISIDLDSKDGGHEVVITIRYQSNDRPMTNQDLIVALDMYLTELCRAADQGNRPGLLFH